MKKQNIIYEVTIRVNPQTHEVAVTKVVDPIITANLLLEGVGILVKDIVAFSATKPDDLTPDYHNLTKKDVSEKLHKYLSETIGDINL